MKCARLIETLVIVMVLSCWGVATYRWQVALDELDVAQKEWKVALDQYEAEVIKTKKVMDAIDDRWRESQLIR